MGHAELGKIVWESRHGGLMKEAAQDRPPPFGLRDHTKISPRLCKSHSRFHLPKGARAIWTERNDKYVRNAWENFGDIWWRKKREPGNVRPREGCEIWYQTD